MTEDITRPAGAEPAAAGPVHPAVQAARQALAATRPLPGAADSGAPGAPAPMTAADQYQAVTAAALAAGNISDFLLHMQAGAVPGGPSAQLMGQAAGNLKRAFACLARARAEPGPAAAALSFPASAPPGPQLEPRGTGRAAARAGTAPAAPAGPGCAR